MKNTCIYMRSVCKDAYSGAYINLSRNAGFLTELIFLFKAIFTGTPGRYCGRGNVPSSWFIAMVSATGFEPVTQ